MSYDKDTVEDYKLEQIKLEDQDIREYETKKFFRRRPYFKIPKSIGSSSILQLEQRCKKSVKYNLISNFRYNSFNQLHYHAGDLNNFERYALLYIRTLPLQLYQKYKKENKKLKVPKLNSIYKKFNLEDVKNTFHYMLNKFKKGIFIVIRNNKLKAYLPFSKAKYINDFFPNIAVNKEDKIVLIEIKKLMDESDQLAANRKSLSEDKMNKLRKLRSKASYNMKEYLEKIGYKQKTNYDRTQWVANNCLFRNSFPAFEGDQNVNVFEVFLVELLKERDIPDCCFFVNLRDHPVLNHDLSEPYDHLFGKKIKINKKYQFENYVPILSFSPHDMSADVPFINPDDIKRIFPDYIYPDKCDYFFQKQYQISKNKTDKAKEWLSKNLKIIFRGKGTGCGLTEETNIRLKVHKMSQEHPDILDAGIVDLNARLKKESGQDMNFIDGTKLELKKFMSMEEQNKFKYHLILEGHAAGYRTGGMFGLNVLIFMAKSKFRVWFSHLLRPDFHFIEIKEDLSDLISKWRWCQDNPKECLKIIQNGNEFYEKYLTKEPILDFAQKTMRKLSKKIFPPDKFCMPKIEKYISPYDPKEKINILIGSVYRDTPDGKRKQQYDIFTKLYPQLVKSYNKYFSTTLLIVEQSEKYDFNRGALCNIIVDLSQKLGKKFTNIFWVDIDTLLSSDGMKYLFKPINGVRMMSLTGTRYQDGDAKNEKVFFGAFLGCGIHSMPKDFPYYTNQVFGWGSEDDVFQHRINHWKIPIESVPENVSTLDLEDHFFNIREKLKDVKQTAIRWEKFLFYYNTVGDSIDGIKDLKYKILSKSKKTEKETDIYHYICELNYDEKLIKEIETKYANKNIKDLENIYRKARRSVVYESTKLLKYV